MKTKTVLGIAALLAGIGCSQPQIPRQLQERIQREQRQLEDSRVAENYHNTLTDALLAIIEKEEPRIIGIGDLQYNIRHYGDITNTQRRSSMTQFFQDAIPRLAQAGYQHLVTDWVLPQTHLREFENYHTLGGHSLAFSSRYTPNLLAVYSCTEFDREFVALCNASRHVRIHGALTDEQIMTAVDALVEQDKRVIVNTDSVRNTIEDATNICFGDEMLERFGTVYVEVDIYSREAIISTPLTWRHALVQRYGDMIGIWTADLSPPNCRGAKKYIVVLGR